MCCFLLLAVHIKGMSRKPVSALCENVPHLSRYTFVPSNKYAAIAQKVCANITRAFSCAGWQKSLLYRLKLKICTAKSYSYSSKGLWTCSYKMTKIPFGNLFSSLLCKCIFSWCLSSCCFSSLLQSVFSLPSLFHKNISRLMRSPCCL
jgi:hypothetical protein